jgi:hypothetical protein
MAAEIPDDELADTRAALAPTLAAAAALLPWLATPRPRRFDDALKQRWVGAPKALASVWSQRSEHSRPLRQSIFALYAIAVESADADCLSLGEALACASDRLEIGTPGSHLIAALSAAIECPDDAQGLEHEAFPQRARHFARRLAAASTESMGRQRAPQIDRMFAGEARERLTLMREALDALPPDAVMLKSEAAQIAEQAETIELYGVMQLARQLADQINGSTDLEAPATRATLAVGLAGLGEAIAALNPS